MLMEKRICHIYTVKYKNKYHEKKSYANFLIKKYCVNNAESKLMLFDCINCDL